MEANWDSAQSWANWDCEVKGQGRFRGRCGRGNHEASEAAIWVPLCKMKVVGSRVFFFFSHYLCLNKPCWKELLLWLSMERFPGMLDQVSGMYRFNEPIWKLTEMEREHSGYITHGITTWVSAEAEPKVPWSFLWASLALSRPESRPFYKFRLGRVCKDHPQCCWEKEPNFIKNSETLETWFPSFLLRPLLSTHSLLSVVFWNTFPNEQTTSLSLMMLPKMRPIFSSGKR